MGLQLDGTGVCDRCHSPLAGYGVTYGLVCTDLAGADQGDRIYCYVNNCRDVVLEGLVVWPTVNRSVCTTCRVEVPRGAADAMLCSDLDPSLSGFTRMLAFCYTNGHRDQLLNQAVIVDE